MFITLLYILFYARVCDVFYKFKKRKNDSFSTVTYSVCLANRPYDVYVAKKTISILKKRAIRESPLRCLRCKKAIHIVKKRATNGRPYDVYAAKKRFLY